MNILVLGHGKYYKDTMRCSPIPKDTWKDQQYISIDINEEIYPDIKYDLRKFPWPINESSFDIIIDTTGLGLSYLYKKPIFVNEINRILRLNGIFYGRKNLQLHG